MEGEISELFATMICKVSAEDASPPLKILEWDAHRVHLQLHVEGFQSIYQSLDSYTAVDEMEVGLFLFCSELRTSYLYNGMNPI